MNDGPRKRTSGIDRALQVIDTLTDRQTPMSAYDIAKSTGAPLSTVYRLVDELIERDMLSREEDGQVWLGPRLMRYGLTYRAKLDVFAAAKREMQRLSKQTGEAVQICARDAGSMVVIAMAESEGHLRVTSDVGSRVPLNWTASGRLLLGHLGDEERISTFAEHAKPSPTGLAETDPKRLAEHSRKDYVNRLAIQISNAEYSVACIAAPIRDVHGACIATISIVLSEGKAHEREDALAEAVQNAALSIERAIGQPSRFEALQPV